MAHQEIFPTLFHFDHNEQDICVSYLAFQAGGRGLDLLVQLNLINQRLHDPDM